MKITRSPTRYTSVLTVDDDLDFLGEHQVADLASPESGEACRKGNKDVGSAELEAQGHGSGEHTNVFRTKFIPANAGHILAGVTSAVGFYATAEGGANANEPRVLLTFQVPEDFVSFSSLKAVWSSEAVSGNMYWFMQAAWNKAGEDYDGTWESESAGATATGGQSKINVQDQVTPLTLDGLAAGDYVGVTFYREGSDGLDTLDNTVDLLGLLFTYVANQ